MEKKAAPKVKENNTDGNIMNTRELIKKLKDENAPLEKIKFYCVLQGLLLHAADTKCVSSKHKRQLTWAQLDGSYSICHRCGWRISMVGGWTSLARSLETLESVEKVSKAATSLLDEKATMESVIAACATLTRGRYAVRELPKPLRQYAQKKLGPLGVLYEKGLPQNITDLFAADDRLVIRAGKLRFDEATLKAFLGTGIHEDMRGIDTQTFLEALVYGSGQKGVMSEIAIIPAGLSTLVYPYSARGSWLTRAELSIREMEVLDALIKDQPGTISHQQFKTLIDIAQAIET